MKLFTSSKCEPCRRLKKILIERGIDFEEVSVDTDEGIEEARKHNILGVPAIVDDNGQVVAVGLPLNKRELENMLKKFKEEKHIG